MKKGFTLIELLAVIVILAIIALIAVPIIINIIDDSKKEALKRSAENYLKAVELAIAKENLNIEFNPTRCTISSGEVTCGVEPLTVTVDGKKPDNGEITLINGTIARDESTFLIYNDKDTLTYDENGKLVFGEADLTKYIKLGEICKVVDVNENNNIDVGEKATCQVNDENNYTFYVLSLEGSNVNLILDRNVYYNSDSDYGLVDEINKGFVAWNISGDSSSGPVTALEYLYNATKSWIKVPNINLNYTDVGNVYKGIETIDSVTKIINKNGNYVDGFSLTNLKTRLPKIGEVVTANGLNSYLYDYLDRSLWLQDESYKPENEVLGINAYWTLTTDMMDSICAFQVRYYGNMGSTDVKSQNGNGVRPVITIPLN